MQLRTSYNAPSPNKFMRCIESGKIEISTGSDILGSGGYSNSVVLTE